MRASLLRDSAGSKTGRPLLRAMCSTYDATDLAYELRICRMRPAIRESRLDVPEVVPETDDLGGVGLLAEAAVVACQGAVQIAALFAQIEAEDGAAVAQIGGVIGEVVLRAAEFGFPERHDLHHALGASRGNGEAVEMAFRVDQGQDQVGAQA